VGFIILVLILLFIAYLKSGKKVENQNEDIANLNLPSTNAAIAQASLTTADCPGVISVASTTEKAVALTYDVGTLPGDLEKTLPAAKAANVPAAFFVTGKIIETNKPLIENIHAAGFPIYNHSYDNLKFTTLSDKEIQAQLQATEDLIKSVSGVSAKPFARLPFGESTPAVVETMRQAGYCPLTWTVDGLDISSSATLDSVATRIKTYIKPGGIILLHAGSDLAATVTPKIVSDLQAMGYRFVSLTELFNLAKINNTSSNVNTPANVNSQETNQNLNQSPTQVAPEKILPA
jgi:peptidoglycan/xylan/chitin deacetylase (PgdA/CDA1 family)